MIQNWHCYIATFFQFPNSALSLLVGHMTSNKETFILHKAFERVTLLSHGNSKLSELLQADVQTKQLIA